MSDFEEFLDKLKSKQCKLAKDRTTASTEEIRVPRAKNKQSVTDAYWESVLEKEKERLKLDLLKTRVDVDAMMVGASSDEDDIPIVATLPRKETNLRVLATVAAETSSPAKVQQKKEKQTRWMYETVSEPTGVSSKYWDADAPSVRATKQLARERIMALNDGDVDGKGMLLYTKSNSKHCE